MKKLIALAAVFVAAFCASANAQEFISVDQVKADGKYVDALAVQGEYNVPGKKCTYQVIARGADKFDIVGYPEALPGEGWDRSKKRVYFTGELKDGKLAITAQRENVPGKEDVVYDENQKKEKAMTAYFADDKLVLEAGGKKYDVQKVERKSPTLGQKAPEGALVIYDGKDRGQFVGDFRLSEAQKDALMSEFRVKPFDRGRSYTLHVEFMLSFMPNATGQARSNSGVYIQEEYECQVLDSFGLNGENNECGGFYQQLVPEVNMCFPPLTWQTYDFDVTPAKYEDGKKVANARIIVKHNGVQIHDAELKHETPGGKNEKDEANEKDGRGLYIQGHGNNVQYRNIWMKYND